MSGDGDRVYWKQILEYLKNQTTYLRTLANNAISGADNAIGIAVDQKVYTLDTGSPTLIIAAETIAYLNIATDSTTTCDIAITGGNTIVLDGVDIASFTANYNNYIGGKNPYEITLTVSGTKCVVELGEI